MVSAATLRITALNGLLVILVLTTGCAPISPAPQQAPYPPLPGTGPITQPSTSSPDPSTEQPGSEIEPAEPELSAAQEAVNQLLQTGWKLHNGGQHERANAIAERALRLDRNNAGIYLLMSSNYFEMWDLKVAEQIAQQGLTLVNRSQLLYLRLNRLLEKIQAASNEG